MSAKSNIIDQLREKLAKAALQSQRGVILQPGAIGDCILTLPLAELMKETVCRGGVDIIGHTEYTGILPGRSCIDAVRSMDSMGLHRLYAGEGEFDLADGDPLIIAFADYTWIATFLGETDSNFERNLIFTAHCSHSAEVMTLAMKPASGTDNHITDFYREQFIEQSGLSLEEHQVEVSMPLIRPSQADMIRGKEILAEHGVMPTRKPVVIHPGSGGKHKCWHLDNFLSVAQMLVSEEAEVVFLLGPAEMERFSRTATSNIGEAARLITNLPLTDVLAVLSCARGFVGNDSGITHLAAALGIRTVAVFGPTNPAVYSPIGPSVTIFRSDTTNFTEAVSEDLSAQVTSALLQ
jgi:ADP-heptose:LPS heptosyltransferase